MSQHTSLILRDITHFLKPLLQHLTFQYGADDHLIKLVRLRRNSLNFKLRVLKVLRDFFQLGGDATDSVYLGEP